MDSGMELPDFTAYETWRDDVSDRALTSIDRYQTYMTGQFAGMGTALNIDAVRFCCLAEGIPRAEWRDVVEESNIIHGVINKLTKPKKD